MIPRGRTPDAGQALARAVNERAAHPASTRATDERAEHRGDVEASARATDEQESGKGDAEEVSPMEACYPLPCA